MGPLAHLNVDTFFHIMVSMYNIHLHLSLKLFDLSTTRSLASNVITSIRNATFITLSHLQYL